MSSERLENPLRLARSSPDRILVLLKTKGPQTAAEVGAALGITGEAARQQLLKLGESGMAAAASEARGVGRPARVWDLTAAGQSRFADAHAELAVQLIRTIRTELGDAALDRLITAREAESRIRYDAALEGARSLEERVERLAALRTEEGYMAEWSRDGGGFLLVENHCPICAAATACQGFCRSELEVFRSALGNEVTVEREGHIVSGDRRCVYRIRPKAKKGRRPAATS